MSGASTLLCSPDNLTPRFHLQLVFAKMCHWWFSDHFSGKQKLSVQTPSTRELLTPSMTNMRNGVCWCVFTVSSQFAPNNNGCGVSRRAPLGNILPELCYWQQLLNAVVVFKWNDTDISVTWKTFQIDVQAGGNRGKLKLGFGAGGGHYFYKCHISWLF